MTYVHRYELFECAKRVNKHIAKTPIPTIPRVSLHPENDHRWLTSAVDLVFEVVVELLAI